MYFQSIDHGTKIFSLKHEYGKVDCIELIRSFYKNESKNRF